MRMSAGARRSIVSGMNVEATVLAGELGRTRRRQRCTRLALRPCASAIRATDAPGCCTPREPVASARRRDDGGWRAWRLPWCPLKFLVDTIVGGRSTVLKTGSPDAYEGMEGSEGGSLDDRAIFGLTTLQSLHQRDVAVRNAILHVLGVRPHEP